MPDKSPSADSLAWNGNVDYMYQMKILFVKASFEPVDLKPVYCINQVYVKIQTQLPVAWLLKAFQNEPAIDSK